MTIHSIYKYNIVRLIQTIILSFLVVFPRSEVCSQPSEDEIKAVALEKLSLFIEWPDYGKRDSKDEFVIAVLGDESFGKVLNEVYRNHKIKDQPVRIVAITDLRQLPECQMLFLAQAKKSNLRKILDHVKALPVLTISDKEGFAREGCFIGIFVSEGKLKFEINLKEMKSAGFNVDYKLLRVARVVDSGSG